LAGLVVGDAGHASRATRRIKAHQTTVQFGLQCAVLQCRILGDRTAISVAGLVPLTDRQQCSSPPQQSLGARFRQKFQRLGRQSCAVKSAAESQPERDVKPARTGREKLRGTPGLAGCQRGLEIGACQSGVVGTLVKRGFDRLEDVECRHGNRRRAGSRSINDDREPEDAYRIARQGAKRRAEHADASDARQR
jgi:hypothetical protein